MVNLVLGINFISKRDKVKSKSTVNDLRYLLFASFLGETNASIGLTGNTLGAELSRRQNDIVIGSPSK